MIITLRMYFQNINQTIKTQGLFRSAFGMLFMVTPLVVLALLIWQEREQLLSIHWNLDPTILLFSFVLYSFALGIAVINWGILMNELGGRLSWPVHFKAYCQTNAARRVPILPWHIIGRVYIYQLHGISRLISSAASALEFLLMLIA